LGSIGAGINAPMSGTLISLPLKIGARVAELGLRGATEIVQRVAGLAGVRSEPSGAPEPAPAPAEPARASEFETTGETAPIVEAEIVDRGDAVDYDASPVAEPEHVDTGEELVEEVAEPGAEDGAGAEVRVAEPWDGYRELRAADVIERVPRASAEELAAVELYELSGRRRQTVIAAAQRELARRR
jgi:hypothetical protein